MLSPICEVNTGGSAVHGVHEAQMTHDLLGLSKQNNTFTRHLWLSVWLLQIQMGQILITLQIAFILTK